LAVSQSRNEQALVRDIDFHPEGKLLGKAALPGKPQGIIVEKKRQRIFANVFNVKQIAVIDRNKRTTS